MPYKYKFRHLPANDKDAAIVGVMNSDDGQETSVGVLEWCWDRQDAERLIQDMKLDNRFVDLEVIDLRETIYFEEA